MPPDVHLARLLQKSAINRQRASDPWVGLGQVGRVSFPFRDDSTSTVLDALVRALKLRGEDILRA